MLSSYNTNSYRDSRSLFGGVDKVALGIYITIALAGLLCITSASFDPDAANIFSTGHNYIKQLIEPVPVSIRYLRYIIHHF